MFFVKRDEAEQWLEQIGRGEVKGLQPDAGDLTNAASVYTANIEGVDAWSLSLAIQRQLNSSGRRMGARRIVLITETGIWPSSEDWYLYYLLRRSQGDWRSIDEAPGHIFMAHEQAEFLTWLRLFFRSGWGGVLAGNSDTTSYAFNHDGHMSIFVHDGSERIAEHFAPLKLAVIRQK